MSEQPSSTWFSPLDYLLGKQKPEQRRPLPIPPALQPDPPKRSTYIHVIEIARLLDITQRECIVLLGNRLSSRGLISRYALMDILAKGAGTDAKRPLRQPIPADIRAAVIARDGLICRYCGQPAPAERTPLDHVMPVSRGGRHEVKNLVVACYSCNRAKHARTPLEAGMTVRDAPDGSNDAVYLYGSDDERRAYLQRAIAADRAQRAERRLARAVSDSTEAASP